MASEKEAALSATPSDSPTIFDKIINKEIPSTVVYEDDKEDPLGFVMEQCHQPFVGEHVKVIDGEGAPSSSSPASIVMLSVSQTQQQQQHTPDVFFTPLDKSLSLPTSADDPPCLIHPDDPQLVDLGRDSSDLGFPHQQQGSLPHRGGINLNPSIPIPAHNFKGESDSSHHLQKNRLKLSHPNPGPVSDSDSSKAATPTVFDVLRVLSENCRGGINLNPSIPIPAHNFEGESDSSHHLQKKRLKLSHPNPGPVSDSDSSKVATPTVFDVLRVLSKNCAGGDDEEEAEDDGLSLLDAFKKNGLTFSRPR